MRDIVFVTPGKEVPFIERALALGYNELVFVYKKKAEKPLQDKRISIRTALVDQKGNDEYIGLGTSLTTLSKGMTMLVNNEFNTEKDFVHQRRSGLNHVWIKECKKLGITVLFNFSKLQKAAIEEVSTYLGRMKQNAKLCKKYGVPFEVVSFSDDYHDMRYTKDVAALTRTLFS